eukprot:1147986-Pelagomonas_calceolata.AAC.2
MPEKGVGSVVSLSVEGEAPVMTGGLKLRLTASKWNFSLGLGRWVWVEAKEKSRHGSRGVLNGGRGAQAGRHDMAGRCAQWEVCSMGAGTEGQRGTPFLSKQQQPQQQPISNVRYLTEDGDAEAAKATNVSAIEVEDVMQVDGEGQTPEPHTLTYPLVCRNKPSFKTHDCQAARPGP